MPWDAVCLVPASLVALTKMRVKYHKCIEKKPCVDPPHLPDLDLRTISESISHPKILNRFSTFNPTHRHQERPPDKEKVQPHLLQQAITDMITQVEDIGQVRNMPQLADRVSEIKRNGQLRR